MKSSTRAGNLPLILAAALALAVAALYIPSRNFDFIVLDDSEYIYENDLVRSGLSFEGVKKVFTEVHQSLWVPLNWLSLMADAELYGMNPGGFHVTNVIFQVINALLLFAFLHRATGSPWKSFFAAALWGMHPLRVESVAWVTERKDLLSGFFFLLCLLAYLEYAKKNSKAWYLASLGAMFAGLASKPILVIMPLVLLAVDFWPLKRIEIAGGVSGLKKLFREKLPFFILAAAFSLFTFYLQQKNISEAGAAPLTRRIAEIPVFYMHYLWETVWPVNLAIESKSALSPPHVIAGTALLLALSFVAWKGRKLSPAVPVGWFWFLAALLPVIGVVSLGLNAVADRFTYLPHMGLFFALVWGIDSILPLRSITEKPASLFAALLLVALFSLSGTQLSHWKDGVTLFSYNIQKTDSAFAASALANAYGVEGNYAEGIRMFEIAISKNPCSPSIWTNLGVMYEKTGRYPDAIMAFKRSLELRPDSADTYFDLGVAAIDAGDDELAISSFENALRLNPKYFRASYNLGNAYKKRGMDDRAAEAFKKAHDLNPSNPEALGELGLLSAKKGDLPGAQRYFGLALALDPNNFESNLYMALSLLESGQMPRSEPFFRKALEINPKDPSAHYNYGVLLEKEGRREESAVHYREVQRLAPESGLSALAQGRLGGGP